MARAGPTNERIYPVSRGWFGILSLGGVLMLAVGLGLGALCWRPSGEAEDSIAVRLFFCAIGVLMAAAGSASILSAFRFRVVLSEDRLRVRQVLGYREVKRKQILGVRGASGALFLVPQDKQDRPLQVPLQFKHDEEFWTWLDGLEDLDLSDQLNAEKEILSNDAFGATDERRALQLEKAAQAVKRLDRFVLALFAWSLIYPRPYLLVAILLLLTPWAAVEMVRRFRGLIRFDGKPGDIYPNVGAALILPGAALFVRAILDWQILGWPKALAYGLLVAAGLLWLFLKFSTGELGGKLATSIASVVFVAYGYGTVITVNCLWQPQAVEIFETRILAKRISPGSRSPTSYVLELEAWGPYDEPTEADVLPALYHRTREGDAVCPALRHGGLGVPWFTVRSCQGQ